MAGGRPTVSDSRGGDQWLFGRARAGAQRGRHVGRRRSRRGLRRPRRARRRLIHGGLRYLEYGDFHLVRESLAERATLRKLAPHLVEPLRLYIPVARRSGRPASIGRPVPGRGPLEGVDPVDASPHAPLGTRSVDRRDRPVVVRPIRLHPETPRHSVHSPERSGRAARRPHAVPLAVRL